MMKTDPKKAIAAAYQLPRAANRAVVSIGSEIQAREPLASFKLHPPQGA